MMEEIRKIGIVPGKFDPSALGPAGLKAIEEGAGGGGGAIEFARRPKRQAGSHGMDRRREFVGRYGTNYQARAAVARVGLGANPPEDATYLHSQEDADGKPLGGLEI